MCTGEPARSKADPVRNSRANIEFATRKSRSTKKEKALTITVKCLLANSCRIDLERYAQCRTLLSERSREIRTELAAAGRVPLLPIKVAFFVKIEVMYEIKYAGKKREDIP